MVQNMRSGGLMALGDDIRRGFSGKIEPFLDEVKGMAESRFDVDLDSQQRQNARMPMVDPSRALNDPRTPRIGAGKGGTPTPTAGSSAFGSPLAMTQDVRSRSSYANQNDYMKGIAGLMSNILPMKEGGVVKAQSGVFFNDGMPTEELLRAIMMQESGGDPKARGSLDEVGAFQIRPSTALLPVGGKSMFPELAAQIGPGKKYKNADEAYLDNKEMIDSALEDVGKSRQFAGDYLGELRSRAGSDEGAIAAYNRGLGGLKGIKDPSQLDYFKGVSSFMPEQDTPSLIDRGKDLASSVVSGISDALSPKEAIAQGVSNPSLAMQGRPFGVTAKQAPSNVESEIPELSLGDSGFMQNMARQMIKEGQVPPESQFIPSDIFKDVYETTDPVTLEKIVEPNPATMAEFAPGTVLPKPETSTKDDDETKKDSTDEKDDESADTSKTETEKESNVTFSAGNPVSSLEQNIIDLQAKLEKSREQDKYLALAQAGLAIMASDSPTLAGAIGEGGVDGLKAFREANQRYEEGVIDLINARAKLRDDSKGGLTAASAITRINKIEDLLNPEPDATGIVTPLPADEEARLRSELNYLKYQILGYDLNA